MCRRARHLALSLSPSCNHSFPAAFSPLHFFSRKNEQCSHVCIQCTFDALFFVFICSASSYQWPTRPVSPFDISAANMLTGEVWEGNYLNKRARETTIRIVRCDVNLSLEISCISRSLKLNKTERAKPWSFQHFPKELSTTTRRGRRTTTRQ